MKKSKKKLKTNLFSIPAVAVIFSFCLILLVFNFTIQQYIEIMTSKSMIDMFRAFDSYYEDPNYNFETGDESEEFVIQSDYIILDSNDKLVYPGEPWQSESEKKRTTGIVKILSGKSMSEALNEPIKIKYNGNVYYVKERIYKGLLEGSYIGEDQSDENSKDYKLIVFTNITPIQNFIDTLNIMLIIIMLVSSAISMIVIYRVAKKIDGSFFKLKDYIIKVGKRECVNELDTLPYDEFNDIAETVQDMSEKIDIAEESQKKFFQNVSHELRTPLMSIQGYAEGIKTGVIKDEKMAADVIINESEKMTNLVDDILYLAKSESEMSKLNKEVLEIKELLYDCLWRIKGAADQKNIRLEHHFPEKSIIFEGDEVQLERAFSNLLSNAIRYARTEVVVSCTENDENIIVKIEDDGKGIPESELPHIFERFFKGNKGNHGIGLSITKEIIEKHGGSISVANNKTVFKVELPK